MSIEKKEYIIWCVIIKVARVDTAFKILNEEGFTYSLFRVLSEIDRLELWN